MPERRRRVPRWVLIAAVLALVAAVVALALLWPKKAATEPGSTSGGSAASQAGDGTKPATTAASSSAPVQELPADVAFVQRDGQALSLDGKPFRMLGFNVWDANVAKPQADVKRTLNTGTGLADTFNALGPATTTVRSWFFQQYVATDGGYDWTPFDRTLAEAKAHHVKVVATIVDQWSYGGTDFRSYDWYNQGYKNSPGTLERVSYRQYVQDLVTRYKDNPTIAAWELVNEPEAFSDASENSCPSDAAAVLTRFASDVAGLVKSIDSKHLVSLGAGGTGTCGTLGAEYQTVMSVPQLDICTLHDYYGPDNAAAYDADNGLNVRVEQCGALHKPIVIGESGIKSNIGHDKRAQAFDAKLTKQLAQSGVVGFLIWQFDLRGSGSDQFVVGPGDPVLAVLQKHAA